MSAVDLGGQERRTAGSTTWSQAEVETRKALEQKLRAEPTNKANLIGLATLFATKSDIDETKKLLERAAIGLNAEEDAFILLRRMGIAHVAMWKGLGGTEDNINTTMPRRQELDDAMMYLEQGQAYPENSMNPASLAEIATTKMHRGELEEALGDLSYIISTHPTFDKLNACIFRAATILRYHGDLEQSLQYLEYIIDVPPTSIGYGAFEIVALLASICDEAEYEGKCRRLFVRLEDDWKKGPGKDKGVKHGVGKPEVNQTFREWAGPWRHLVDKSLRRCDYVLCSIFLHELLKREASVEGYIKLAEVLYVVGDKERAIKTVEQAHKGDPEHEGVRLRLMAWAPQKWRAQFDLEEAKRQAESEVSKAAAQKNAEIDQKGLELRKYRHRKACRTVLSHWHKVWTINFGQVQIARVFRGHRDRRYAFRIRVERDRVADLVRSPLMLLSSLEKMTNVIIPHRTQVNRGKRKIYRRLMVDVIVAWYHVWKSFSDHRFGIAGPTIRRKQQQCLMSHLAAWHHAAIELAATRRAVSKALKASKDNFGFKTSFHSKPLQALSNFNNPGVKEYCEERNRLILENKRKWEEGTA